MKKCTKLILMLLLITITAPTASNAQFSANIVSNTMGLANKPLSQMILDVTNWLVGFVIILSFAIIIFATINPAGLDDEGATNKKMITYGIVGLVIAGISWVIIYTVVSVILT